MSKLELNDFDAVVAAPFGAVGIKVEHDYLSGLRLMPQAQAEYCADQPFVQHAALTIKRYLADASVPLDIPFLLQGTPFQQRVWRMMQQIPLGEVWSYGALAERVHSGPRAVANVCGANLLPLLIPCHRIVAKQGLGGFMKGVEQGLDIKRWLLQHEQR